MKKLLLIVAIAACMVGCEGGKMIKTGTAITVDGDTIVFYGGTIPYTFKGARMYILDINIEQQE